MKHIVLLVVLTSSLELVAQSTEPSPFSSSMLVSPEWRSLHHEAVQTELKLSPTQKASFDFLADWSLYFTTIRFGSLGYIPATTARELLPKSREHYLTTTLTKAQHTRLRQIVFQLKVREFGAHAAFTMVAKDLGLRPDQLEDVKSIRGVRVEEIAKLVTSGERFDAVKTKVEKANVDTFERMTEMLTRAQRERWKEVKGESFAGKVEFDKRPSPTHDLPRFPKELFGLYDLELSYLQSEIFRDELKITGVQKNELRDARIQWHEACGTNNYFPSTLTIARLHDVTAKSIQAILSKDQRHRLDELMMQRREKASPEAMCGHPAAVAALKLTPIQLKRLSEGGLLADVLTPDQQEARPRMLGQICRLPTGVGDQFVNVGPAVQLRWGSRAFAHYFLNQSNRLGLSAVQVKQLQALSEDEPKFFELIQQELSFANLAPVEGAGRGLAPAGAVAEQYREASEAQAWNVLDDKQKSLARQLFGGKR